MGRSKKLWIQDAIKHPGALRKSLHAKPGHKIPEAKLEKAMHSKSPLMRERANLAHNFRKMRKSARSR